MTKTVLEELEAAWSEFVLLERNRAVETEAEVHLRMSGQTEAWGKSDFYVLDSLQRARKRDLEKMIDDLYERAEISDRERRLVQAGWDTACCCNNESVAYAWCSVVWPKESVQGL